MMTGLSLTWKQSARIAVTAFAVGLATGALQVREAFVTLRVEMRRLHADIHELTDPALSHAIALKDTRHAEDLISGIMHNPLVRRVAIFHDDQRSFLSRENPPHDSSRLTAWIAETLLSDVEGSQQILFDTDMRDTGRDDTFMHTGWTEVNLDTGEFADRLVTQAGWAITTAVAQAAVLATLLGLVFHILLTRPLIRLGHEIAAIDPNHLENREISIPDGHETDELGLVAMRFQETLSNLLDAQAWLRRLATHDPLTGLPNRAYLETAIGTEVAQAERAGTRGALMAFGIDNFKAVNDALGHSAGDALLIECAKRLRQCARESDILARFTGDDLALVAPAPQTPEGLAHLAERLIASMRDPFNLADETVYARISLGIVMFPGDGKDAQTLLSAVDTAVYAAKKLGGDRWQFFSQSLMDTAVTRIRTESALHRAAKSNEFELHVQPIYSADGPRLLGGESLIRWRREDRLVSPGEFIGIAESCGVIGQIGDWAIEESCRRLVDWHGRFGPLRLSVNVSPRQISDDSFPKRVAMIIEHSGVDPSSLYFEFTETSLMSDMARAVRLCSKFRAMGIAIALDDFGVGYSSLSQLHMLPIDLLKIDRRFVAALPNDHAVVSMVLALAHNRSLKTVAEGVETQPQFDWLAAHGCDAIQGYLLGRPEPPDAFARRLEQELDNESRSANS